MRGAGSLYLICVGLLFCVAGSGFAWLMWRSYDRASGQRDWVEVDCTIIESRIEERKIGEDVKAEYSFTVLYGYTHGGQALTSERHSLRGSSWSGAEARAASLVEKYPEGAQRRCYLNPAEPSFAVLKRDSKAPGYSLWFPIIFVVGGLGIIVGAVRSWVAGGRKGGEAEESQVASRRPKVEGRNGTV